MLIVTASFPIEKREILSFCQGFLSKPVSRSQLVTQLKQLMITIKLISALNHLDNYYEKDHNKVLSNHTQIVTNHTINLAQLIEKLNDYEEKKWQNLCQTMFMEELQELVECSQNWVQEHHCVILLNYSHNLAKSLAQFDLAQVQQQLANFPKLKNIIT